MGREMVLFNAWLVCVLWPKLCIKLNTRQDGGTLPACIVVFCLHCVIFLITAGLGDVICGQWRGNGSHWRPPHGYCPWSVSPAQDECRSFPEDALQRGHGEGKINQYTYIRWPFTKIFWGVKGGGVQLLLLFLWSRILKAYVEVLMSLWRWWEWSLFISHLLHSL